MLHPPLACLRTVTIYRPLLSRITQPINKFISAPLFFCEMLQSSRTIIFSWYLMIVGDFSYYVNNISTSIPSVWNFKIVQLQVVHTRRNSQKTHQTWLQQGVRTLVSNVATRDQCWPLRFCTAGNTLAKWNQYRKIYAWSRRSLTKTLNS